MSTARRVRLTVFIWVLTIASSLISMAMLGKLTGVEEPDSALYLHYDWSSWQSALSGNRTPGYPLFVWFVQHTLGAAWLPLMHWVALIGAVLVFYFGLQRAGVRREMALAAAVPLCFSRAVFDLGHLLTTDSLAISLAIATTGCFYRTFAAKVLLWEWVAFAVASFATILTRPAYLFFLLFWPLLHLLLSGIANVDVTDPWRHGFRKLINATAAMWLPFIAYCAVRFWIVGHFGLVAFGGYNIIGVAGQALDESLITDLSPNVQPLAQEILSRRGAIMETVTPQSYRELEEGYNPTIWQAADPAVRELHGDDTIQSNRLMSQLSREILLRRPTFYGRWLYGNAAQAIKKSARLTGRDLGTMLAACFWIAAIIVSAGRRSYGEKQPYSESRSRAESRGEVAITGLPRKDVVHASREIHLLFWTASGFFLSKTLLVILVEPSLDRYLMAAMCLLPAVIGMVIVQHIDACVLGLTERDADLR